jgi:serine/threonine-protein kinase
VFAAGIGNGGLWTVSADGGTPTQITKLAESAAETNHLWPDFLPDGSVLFTALGPSGHAQDAKLVVRDIAAATSTVVVEHATYGRYLAGHLIYTDGTGTLLLQPFDLANRRTTGPARAVLSGVRLSTWGGAVPYAVSRSGTLAYATGTEFSEGVLVELDHSGRELRRFGGPQSIEFVTLSPDGGTLAACVRSPTNDDIHLIDVGSGRSSRFTYDISEDESPVWSPDGRHIAYSAAAVGEQRRIVVKEIGGTQAERVLHTGKRHLHLTSWSADGWIAFDEFTQRSVDTWAVNVDDPSKLLPLGTSDENEEAVVFAPDGKSIAYHSDVTGRYEVYVKSFPALNPLQQVSGEGGLRPQWSDNGDTLTFFNRAFLAPVRMMRARRAGAARGMPWQETELFRVPSVSDYSVSGDGRRFYHVARNPDSPAPEIQVIVNWLAEVEAQPSSR